MDFENRLHIELNENSFHRNWMLIITWNQYKLSSMIYILCVCNEVRFIVSRNFRENILTKSFPYLHTMNMLWSLYIVLWKKRELHSHRKKFRQIYLVFSLVKLLLSRNFCEKSVRENFCNFHIVMHYSNTVGKNKNPTLIFFVN